MRNDTWTHNWIYRRSMVWSHVISTTGSRKGRQMTKKEAISIFKNERGVKVFPINTKLSIKEYYYKREKAIDMAIEALQFQDIMINNPQTAKPTPVVCKNCQENNRPKGEWIVEHMGNGWNEWSVLKCPLCGAIIEDKQYHSWGYNYCPNCGKRIKGGDIE